jgi:hypothetical protein
MNRKFRVIFIFLTKFSKRDFQRWGCDIIQKRGYEVEVWDCSPWLNPEYSMNYNVPDPFDFTGLKVFKTFESTKSAFSEITQKDIIIDPFQLLLNHDFGKINGAKVVRLFCGEEPTPLKVFYKISTYDKYFKSLYADIKKNPLKIFTKIKKKFFMKKLLPYNVIILGGTDGDKHIVNCVNYDSTSILRAHALDYDRYLEEETKDESKGNIPKVPYAVFLDQNWLDHPDQYINGLSTKLLVRRPELFFPEINNFFKKFSCQSGLDIVIAAHPRSNYNTQNNHYDGNITIRGETVSLVKGAKVVIAHKSISLNFAVLYHKPVILLDSDYNTQFLKNYLDLLETELGAHQINISHTQSITLKDVIVDKVKYRQFKEKFIKEPGTPEKFTGDIICDYLDKMN